MLYKTDLHIHSCLSPCASLELSPRSIAGRARRLGLHIAALTDHNSTLNLPAFRSACKEYGITAVFGMELNSREEVHCLCLFDTLEAALDFGSFIRPLVPEVPNNPEAFGDQVWVDEDDVIQGVEERLLLTAADLSVDDACIETLRRGGLFIPAHIDRPSFSVFSQLGFLPDLAYSALESVSHPCSLDTGDRPVIANSDAHELSDFGKRHTIFDMKDASFGSLKAALAGGKFRVVC